MYEFDDDFLDDYTKEVFEEYENDVPPESESEYQSNPLDKYGPETQPYENPSDLVNIQCYPPSSHQTTDILEFINNNPNSLILIPTSEKGLLRLSRNVKRGYKCTLIQSFKDCMEYLNKHNILQ